MIGVIPDHALKMKLEGKPKKILMMITRRREYFEFVEIDCKLS
jgi:hypothetical protein